LRRVRVNLFGISTDYWGKSVGIVPDVTQVEGLHVGQEENQYDTSFTGLYECMTALFLINKQEERKFYI